MVNYKGFLFNHGDFMYIDLILIINSSRLNTTNNRKSRIKKFTQMLIFFKCHTICTLSHTTRYFSSITHNPNCLHQVNQIRWYVFYMMKWYCFDLDSIKISIPILYNPIKTSKCPSSKSIIISYSPFIPYSFTQFRNYCRRIT
jgi:hypothetical protein